MKPRILIAIKETAGDIFIISGVVSALKKKYSESCIYVATDPKYHNILEGNPNITGILAFHDSMYNYRSYTKWAVMDNPFDIVFCPALLTQCVPGNWLNNTYAYFLGDFYANQCNVEYDEQFIKLGDISHLNLPEEYITIHPYSSQDPKNYDKISTVLSKIRNIKTVQVGAATDRKVNADIDLRGKTTFQQLAAVIKGAKAHIGMDSICMHIAGYVGTPAIILFGGTLPQAGVNPRHNITVIEPPARGPCVTSCHLIDCIAKQRGFDKCINNIPVSTVVQSISNLLGPDYIETPPPVKISSYMIIRDGIKYGFPFEKCIEAAAKISDEVVIVDGGSTDNTFENLKIASVLNPKMKLYQHPWDLDNPMLFGDEKQYARSLCTGTHLIQLDVDEIIVEPQPGMIRKLIENNADTNILDLPCINFYGDAQTIRIEPNCWKWRISRNDPNIVHGVHGAARQFDADNMRIIFDKKVSDGCEYIYADSLNIAEHRIAFNPALLALHEAVKKGEQIEKYIELLQQILQEGPVVFHYSWLDLNRKQTNGTFWDETFFGKKKATHNTTDDIANRIKNAQDILLNIDINHPLKGTI